MRYVMAIDLKRCVGCHACEIACKSANNVPEGIFWNKVHTIGGEALDAPAGEYPVNGEAPNFQLSPFTMSCQHCENPSCVKVCPVGATYVDPTTGIVRQDYDVCIGCRMCISACPYTGVRSFNWDEPKYALDFGTGDSDVPQHQKHVVEKCTFCYQRVTKGQDPACMELCPERARHWGDIDDPNSDVSKLLVRRSHKKLLEDRGTEPNVYFLT